jgi:hypothetical protein
MSAMLLSGRRVSDAKGFADANVMRGEGTEKLWKAAGGGAMRLLLGTG